MYFEVSIEDPVKESVKMVVGRGGVCGGVVLTLGARGVDFGFSGGGVEDTVG